MLCRNQCCGRQRAVFTLSLAVHIMQLTYDFRLEDSPEERARITASGAILRRLAESGRGPCEAHEVRALLLLRC